jgi:competence protein ComEC
MLAVARHVPVAQVYWNGFEGSRTEQKVRKQFIQKGTLMNVVKAGDATRVGDVDVSVLSPPTDPILATRSPENENSVILLIRYGTKSILLTGDVEQAGERILIATQGAKIRNISLLKVAHHGSDSSSMRQFVRRTHPGTAFVSCGKRNRYGHPSDDVINRLERVGADVYRTDQCGMLEWMTDGQSEAVATMLPCNKNALREAQGVTD